MEAEDTRGGDERDGQPENPRVSSSSGRFPGEEGKRSGQDPREEDEPEVGGLVFPVKVEAWVREQEREPGDGRDEEDRQRRD
jgi:hypothetical protein